MHAVGGIFEQKENEWVPIDGGYSSYVIFAKLEQKKLTDIDLRFLGLERSRES